MAKVLRSVWEAIKSLLILFLIFSAVYLTYQLLLGSGAGPFPTPIDTTPAATVEPASSIGVPRPIRMAVTNDNGRYAVQYDDAAVDELFDNLGSLLGEALSSCGVPSSSTRFAWERAMQCPGIYFEFPGSVPLPLIAAWLGTGEGAAPPEATVSRLLLSETADTGDVSLYYFDVQTELYYSCQTIVQFSDALSGYIPNGATFAFLQGAQYRNLEADTMLLEDAPSPPIYLASGSLDLNDSGVRSTLLDKLGFHPQSNAIYPSADGWSVRDGGDTLRLTSSGTVTFRSGGDNRYPAPPGASQTDLIELTGRLVQNAVIPHCGSARVYLSDITSTQDAVTLTYAYTLSGAEVQLGQEGWCAQFIVRDGQITDYTLRLRRYTPTEQRALLLPEYQAMAAMDAMDMTDRELILRYYDGGIGTVAPAWIAR